MPVPSAGPHKSCAPDASPGLLLFFGHALFFEHTIKVSGQN